MNAQLWLLILRGAAKAPNAIKQWIQSPRSPSRKELEQQAAEWNSKREFAEKQSKEKQERYLEDVRKGLVLPPEQSEALYKKGMNFWKGGFLVSKDKEKAIELLRRAAQNGHGGAQWMARAHDFDY